MRKEKWSSVDTPALTKAWEAFFEDVSVADPADLKGDGWMTNMEIAEHSKLKGVAGRQLADIANKRGVLEKKVVKIIVNGRRKAINFYRPILFSRDSKPA